MSPMRKRLLWALALVSRYAWWDCQCLTQAIAVKLWARRRGYRTTLVLGVSPTGPQGMRAHAWLFCGQEILTGAAGREQYTPVARFTEV